MDTQTNSRSNALHEPEHQPAAECSHCIEEDKSCVMLNNHRPTSLANVKESLHGDEITLKKLSENTEHTSIKKTRNKKSVTFDSINIREYDVILGDNPACSDGPPLSLDWTFTESTSSTIDDYEEVRGYKRHRKFLYLSAITRRNLLINRLGYSRSEVNVAEDNLKITKYQRKETKLISTSKEKRQVFLQSAHRKIKRKLSPLVFFKEAYRTHMIPTGLFIMIK